MLAAVAAYFALRAIARTCVSDTLELDEAEQLIQAQAWAWGYRHDPPLYMWLQKLFFMGLGLHIFPLALLKNLLLFGTCALTWRAGQELAGSRGAGPAAALSLFFVPQFVWASQVDLTHSVLAMLFVAATFFLLAKLFQRRTVAHYVCLGVVAAAGVLSKYNYVAFFAVCILALLTFPDGRRVMTDKRFALTAVTSLVLLWPHLNWVWNHRVAALRRVPGVAASGEMLAHSRLEGFSTLALSLAMYALPIGAAWILILGRLPARRDVWPADGGNGIVLCKRVLAWSIALYVAAILILQAKFKERWIQPNLLALPLLVAGAMASELTAARLKRCAMLAGLAAVAVFLILSGRVLLAGVTDRPLRQNMPYRELAEHVHRAGIQPDTIIAENRSLGAAFRMAFPEAVVIVPGLIPAKRPGSACLVVCEVDPRNPTLEPMRRLAGQYAVPQDRLSEGQFVSAPLKYCPNRELRIAYALVAGP